MARIPSVARLGEPAAGYARLPRGHQLRAVAPIGNVRPAAGMPQELAAVLDGLHESDIASQAHVGSRIDLWIGEHRAGPRAQASFGSGEARSAARWLHRRALRLFPASRYARAHSRRFDPVAILARMWRPF